jgi:hypothetical protein
MTTVSKGKASRQLSLAELLERRQRQRIVESENIILEEANAEIAHGVVEEAGGKEEEEEQQPQWSSLSVERTEESFSGYVELSMFIYHRNDIGC